ncbi:hypothetical protein KNO30_04795 [Taylorella equigenitalis]|uniref:hypothetical protein n=1 Tax=Taylorella equigenitalis TaxID=29575 RepID=UPI0003F4DD6C|nr:hypothetical protein [Taylorella equigenitalis]WDU47372.1 hypothetical protein KNO30_04795 [Taylorella equigenitalis]
MYKISIQFFAHPEELIKLSNLIKEKTSAEAVYFKIPFMRISEDKLSKHVKDINCVFFIFNEYQESVSRYDALHKNPDSLVLEFGQVDEVGLNESRLACQTDKENIFKIWKRAANILRKYSTSLGFEAYSIKTGLSSKANSRYTNGAAELYESGVPLVQPGTIVRYRITDRKILKNVGS